MTEGIYDLNSGERIDTEATDEEIDTIIRTINSILDQIGKTIQ